MVLLMVLLVNTASKSINSRQILVAIRTNSNYFVDSSARHTHSTDLNVMDSRDLLVPLETNTRKKIVIYDHSFTDF